MARKIVWTKRSTNKFNTIIDFLEQEWGETVTRNFVKRAYDIVDLLARQPTMGTTENVDKNIKGFLLTRHNKLFYRVTETEIILLNFFDTRSNKRKY